MNPSTDNDVDQPTTTFTDTTTSRRRFFALAGGAAAVAVAATAISAADPASATNGEALLFGVTKQATPLQAAQATVLDYSPATGLTNTNYFTVTDSAQLAVSAYPSAVAGYAEKNASVGVYGYAGVVNGAGVLGRANPTAGPGAYAVWGKAASGYGVYAESDTGIDLAAGGTGRFFMEANVAVGPPPVGTYALGEIVRDKDATMYICIKAGTPGLWRTLGGGNTAGSLYLINPTRVYDSRLPNFGGPLASGASRLVSAANGVDLTTGKTTAADIVPPGATGITYNLTISGAVNNGFLAVTPGDAATYSASTINWTSTTPTLANGTVVKLDAKRQVKVFAGGGGSTEFIVDVTGYYA